jgi:putative endonuclease
MTYYVIARHEAIAINNHKIMKPGFIYIITNSNHTTLYIGVTSNLPHRILEYKEKRYPNSFSARYNLSKLVYFEQFQMIGDAIAREKQLKGGSRLYKFSLVENANPFWNDLFDDIKDIMIM